MHDMLYANQGALRPADLVRYAHAIGLDVPRFVRELSERVHEARVREDFLSGVRSGANGTPSFFVNGRRHDGPWDARTQQEFLEVIALSASRLAALVDNLLDAATLEAGALRLQREPVRVDREQIVGPSLGQIASVVAAVQKKLPEIDAIIFEDYGKGFLTADLVTEITRHARAANKIVTADPNSRNLIEWTDMTAVKPNRAEAFLAAGIPWRDPDESPQDHADLVRAGNALLEKWKVENVLITLGEYGMMLFQKNGQPHHIPTKARQVFDVSGAGDTAIALFTLALACGATAIEAAEIANHASAVVVGKLGTATVSRSELLASFEHDFD